MDVGEFVSPGTKRLKTLLQKEKYDDKTKKIISQKGLILINQSYYRHQQPNSDLSDLYVTLIHETLHANRDLLLFDHFREGKNELAYSYNNGKLEQNIEKFSSKHVDASQEILKGIIDNSKNTLSSYASKTSKEIEDMKWPEGEIEDMERTEDKINAQMEKQRIVDEALIELMAALSYNLYSAKQNGKELDIWTAIEQARDSYEGDDIGTMCEIILKHHDFDLFYWMIDPISYSQGDIHYDFFKQYTKNDQDLVEHLSDAGEIHIDDEVISDPSAVNQITTSDIKKVANSTTAIEELLRSFEDIKQAQTQSRKDNER